MKYPPTSKRGSPVSACQRSGSVNAADQPAGTGVAAATGSGFGTIGRTARTAAAITTATGRQPAASAGILRAANAAKTGTAASTAKASSAAAAPSATSENRSGSADSSSGRLCSQYHGSLIAGWWWAPNSRVPASENTPSTRQATATARAGSRRQQPIAASTSTTSSGQPR